MKVEVKGPHRPLLKPEMTANVVITVVEKEEALLLPVNAVGRDRRERFVTVRKTDGTTEQRRVEVGASDGEMLEITGGLAAGAEVVLSGDGAPGRWRRQRVPPLPPLRRHFRNSSLPASFFGRS